MPQRIGAAIFLTRADLRTGEGVASVGLVTGGWTVGITLYYVFHDDGKTHYFVLLFSLHNEVIFLCSCFLRRASLNINKNNR